MEALISFLVGIPQEVWIVLAEAVGVSALLQAFKHWLSLQSEKFIVFLLGALSFLTSVFDYISQQTAQDPTILGPNTLMIMGLATAVYRYGVKPTSNLLSDVRAFRAQKAANVPLIPSAAPTSGGTTTPEAASSPTDQLIETPIAPYSAPAADKDEFGA